MAYNVGDKIELVFMARSTSNIYHVLDYLDVEVTSTSSMVMAESSLGIFHRVLKRATWEWILQTTDCDFRERFIFHDFLELQQEISNSRQHYSSAYHLHLVDDVPNKRAAEILVMGFDPDIIATYTIAA